VDEVHRFGDPKDHRDDSKDHRAVRRSILAHRRPWDDACRGVAEWDGHWRWSAASDVGVAESDGHWRWWAASDVSAPHQPRRLGAGWGGSSEDHQATVLEGQPAWEERRCACEQSCEARSNPQRPVCQSTPRVRTPRSGRPAQQGRERQPRRRERAPERVPRLPRGRRPSLCPCPWPSMALPAGRHDGGRRRQHDGGYGPPGRPRWTPRGSKRQYPACQRGRAAPCSLDRALSRARVPGSSSAPKRSLTSVRTTVHTVPYSFTTTTATDESTKDRQLLTSSSLNERRSAF